MKKALITGASRGIGKATARKFLSQGYEVFQPTRGELDLNDGQSISNYINNNRNKHFDVIVNNAGCNDINLIEDITDSEIVSMMNINVVAPLKLIRGFVGGMKGHKYGRIINIGSIWGAVSKSGRCVYSATKNGIHGITNTLAVELAPDNILVNTVCPGFTLTELTSKNNTPTQIKKIAEDIPMERLAKPEEIAEIVYFLASEQNTYLTGQKVIVDGGFTSK